MFLMFSVLLSVALLTSCSKGCNRRREVSASSGASSSPGPSSATSPAPDGTPHPHDAIRDEDQPDEDKPITIAGRFKSSVRQLISAVFLRGSPRPIRPARFYALGHGDRIRTDEFGTAEVNIADCMTVYLYEASGLTLSTCPGFARGSAVCSTAGTGLFNNKCRSRIKKIETSTAEINLEGTWLRVAYWPAKKRTLIDVHEGPVYVRQVLDPISRRLGEPILINEGCWCAPSEQCFMPGVPSNGPRACTDLTAENKAYLARTKDKAGDQAIVDNKPIAPAPKVEDSQVGAPILDNSLNFGEHPTGVQTVKDLLIENSSSLPLKFNEVLVDDPSGSFRLVSETCRTDQVESGNKCSLSVAFKPLTTGPHEAILNIRDNAKGSPRRISLRGSAVSPKWRALVTTLVDFQNQLQGVSSERKIVGIMNSDVQSVNFGEVTLEGAAKDDFKVVSNTCKNGVSECIIEVVFTPLALGPREATMIIPARVASPGASFEKKIVELRGVGIDGNNPLGPDPTTTPRLALADNKVCFDGYKVVDPKAVQIRKTETITIANKGNAPLVISSVVPNNDDFLVKSESCTRRKVTDSCEVTVGFTPRDTRTRTGLLMISSNDPKTSMKEVPLAGRGKHRNWFVRGVQWVFRINQKNPCKS